MMTSRADREAWAKEYDRRLNDPTVAKDKMKNGFNPFRPTETRVADDEGTMRRRNGEGCCGCGQWKSTTYRLFAVWDRNRNKDHHRHEDGSTKRGKRGH